VHAHVYGARMDEAALRLRMTAPELHKLGAVDAIVDEPVGGAHQDHDAAARLVDTAIREALESLDKLGGGELAEHRYQRFRRMGAFSA
jgi:acetyl-CoA carboxylase carboxyl transferase subunit alpha